MKTKTPPLFNLEDFAPSLRQEMVGRSLDLKKIILVALPVKDHAEPGELVPNLKTRRLLALSDGKNVCFWETDSLRALFRGNRQPPVLGDYPEAYNETFMLFDLHALEFSKFFGDRRDAELLEIYSTLRRRPDGRSLGLLHDYLWQAAAFVLGTRPLSQAEFEAILARLERSCRTFELGPGSRNLIAALRETFGR